MPTLQEALITLGHARARLLDAAMKYGDARLSGTSTAANYAEAELKTAAVEYHNIHRSPITTVEPEPRIT